MHNSYNQIFYSTVFCLLYTFRTNLVGMIVPKLCNTVYYTVLLMMNYYVRSKHVKQTKGCGIKKMTIRIVHLLVINTLFKAKVRTDI